MTSVVVGGALANKAGSAGEAWVRMSWVRGFQQLGLDVRFVEELAGERVDPAAVAWFEDVTKRFGVDGRSTLLHAGDAIVGPDLTELEAIAPEATLVNISGHLQTPTLMRAFRRRVMVDIDPGFTQFWHEQGIVGANVAGHDLFFTIGELIGTPQCPVPTGGIEWLPVKPPVVLSDWPASEGELDRFTTIATWRGAFGRIEHSGRTYGLKVHEFRKFIDLPEHSDQSFEIALDIHPADTEDLEALGAQGWRIVDPRAVAGDPDAFRAYVQGSGAEFSVAQGIYVDTNCGWFSDRTTRYLASGRPALVQDTGFSATLPVGEGLVAFTTLDEAIAGAADIADRYPEHCEAARRLAEEHFDATRVLARFCEQAGIGRGTPRRASASSRAATGINVPEPTEPSPGEIFLLEGLRQARTRRRASGRGGARDTPTRRAVLTMVHNEPVFLPIWLGYYSRFFGPDDIYVLDHDTSDGSTEREGFIRIPVSHETVDHTWMVRTIEQQQRELLEQYDAVLVTDVDEMVVPRPECGTLGEYIDRLEEPFVNCLGYEVIHLVDREGPFDPSRPVLDQRGYWFTNGAYNKPALAMEPIRWVPGFHAREDGETRIDPDLCMLHLHRMDYEICLARHRYRHGRRWNERDLAENWARHNLIVDESEFARWFYEDRPFEDHEIVVQAIPSSWRGLF